MREVIDKINCNKIAIDLIIATIIVASFSTLDGDKTINYL